MGKSEAVDFNMELRGKIRSMVQNRTLVNGTLFAGFSFVNKGFSFILLLIIANYTSPAEYGLLNLFSTVTVVVGYFIAMSSEGYWSVSYFREGFDGLKKTFSCIVFISTIVLLVLLSALLLAGDGISSVLSIPKQTVYIAVFICFFNVYYTIFLDQYRLEEQVWKYGIASIGGALMNFAFAIVFVKMMMLGWVSIVYAQLACAVLLGATGFFALARRDLLTKKFLGQLKPLLYWSIPVIPHVASTFIRQGCDRYIINAYYGIEDVGLFSFALNIANIITMIGMGFNQSNSVDIYKTLGNKDLTDEQKMSSTNRQRKLFSLVCLICTIIVGVAGYLFLPVILPRYSGAKNYFILLTCFGFFSCQYYLWTNYLFFYKKTKNMMYITFGTATVHLILSLLVTRYSLYYTALLYSFSQGIIVLLVRWQAKKALAENLPMAVAQKNLSLNR